MITKKTCLKSSEILNFSATGQADVPREVSQWRRHFPALRLLDLSHNNISQLQVEQWPPKRGFDQIVTFDLRHNNMTHIDMDILREWSAVDKFLVDVRDNPIHCGCYMAAFIPLTKNSFEDIAQYAYVGNMTCASPHHLRGHPLHSLKVAMLPCEVIPSDTTALVALSVVCSILLLAMLAVMRWRVEIRILLYTRMHVRLPCDNDIQSYDKAFDAFVSYSSEDDEWVFENVVRYLENKEDIFSVDDFREKKDKPEQMIDPSRKAFKLCLHQVCL